MEPPDWFIHWVGDYAAAFGLTRYTDWLAAMLRFWWRAFVAMGYTRDELEAAVPVALGDAKTPTNLPGHLALVKRAVALVRHRAASRPEETPAATGPVCPLCGNIGFVIVPDPRDVRDGEWVADHLNDHGDPVYREAAVVCTRCGPGLKARNGDQSREGRPARLTIDAYEARVNPAWREHLAQRAADRREAADAERMAASQPAGDAAGSGFAGLVGRIVGRMRQLPPHPN